MKKEFRTYKKDGTIGVKFELDSLTKEEYVEDTTPRFGYDTEIKPNYILKRVPIKTMDVYPKYIKLTEY